LERNVYWIAYVTLGLAVGAIVGYVQGHKQGYVEGWDGCADVQRTAHKLRGLKAAATRKAKVAP
jgi:hypothetical protein